MVIMELIVLGSGTYQPELERHASSYLVKVGKSNLVFDFGRGALDGLMKAGVNYWDIDAIFITHIHADHCEELVPFLHIALAEVEKYAKRSKDISIFGPKGFASTVEHILLGFNLAKKTPKYKILVKELDDDSLIKGAGWEVRCYTTEHTPELNSLAYRLEAEKKVLAYSGDATYCDGVWKACKNADLAIVEASWPAEMKPDTHMTGVEAGKVAHESEAKKLIITHISPSYMKIGKPKEEAARYFGKKNVIVAIDQLRVKV